MTTSSTFLSVHRLFAASSCFVLKCAREEATNSFQEYYTFDDMYLHTYIYIVLLFLCDSLSLKAEVVFPFFLRNYIFIYY